MNIETARTILKLRYPGEYILVQIGLSSSPNGDSESAEVYCVSKGWSGVGSHSTFEDSIDALFGKKIEQQKKEGEHGTEKS